MGEHLKSDEGLHKTNACERPVEASERISMHKTRVHPIVLKCYLRGNLDNEECANKYEKLWAEGDSKIGDLELPGELPDDSGGQSLASEGVSAVGQWLRWASVADGADRGVQQAHSGSGCGHDDQPGVSEAGQRAIWQHWLHHFH